MAQQKRKTPEDGFGDDKDKDKQLVEKKHKPELDTRTPRQKTMDPYGTCFSVLILAFADVRMLCNLGVLNRDYKQVVHTPAQKQWHVLARMGGNKLIKEIRFQTAFNVMLNGFEPDVVRCIECKTMMLKSQHSRCHYNERMIPVSHFVCRACPARRLDDRIRMAAETVGYNESSIRLGLRLLKMLAMCNIRIDASVIDLTKSANGYLL
jgi:hypothetical protein